MQSTRNTINLVLGDNLSESKLKKKLRVGINEVSVNVLKQN